ncbi:MerR family transcriptional regulator [Streptococcus plurextorum]|uniref:MerR family transcriptional regulator n=1 Tax=Streptococcus plurextorum TaxID=456876 RepID=UPI0003F4B95D|nr:MerR family transcriptional regulator [Streptococcus plurextorum]
MKTVKEVSQLAGVSIRTLHHYDKVGLLKPTALSQSGYRLYDDQALLRLQTILLFRELDMPLKYILDLLDADEVTKQHILAEQLQILQLKRRHLDKIIGLTQALIKGDDKMDFTTFNQEELKALQEEAKSRWGHTEAYQDFQARNAVADVAKLNSDMMTIFAQFKPLMTLTVDDSLVQRQVKHLQSYISQHFYPCNNQILEGLGEMYSSDSRFTETIDQHAGQGVSQFVSQAIAHFVKL